MKTAAGRNQTAVAGDLKRVEQLGAFVAIKGSYDQRKENKIKGSYACVFRCVVCPISPQVSMSSVLFTWTLQRRLFYRVC